MRIGVECSQQDLIEVEGLQISHSGEDIALEKTIEINLKIHPKEKKS